MLAPLRRVSPAYEREVESVFALVAYESPADSPLQQLVSDREREAVADLVNAAILLDAQRTARAAAIAAETGGSWRSGCASVRHASDVDCSTLTVAKVTEPQLRRCKGGPTCCVWHSCYGGCSYKEAALVASTM